jgi:TRAP-type C4-dicarboxylate transport system permease small subunit
MRFESLRCCAWVPLNRSIAMSEELPAVLAADRALLGGAVAVRRAE